MQFVEEHYEDVYPVQSYETGLVCIADMSFTSSVALVLGQKPLPVEPSSMAALTPEVINTLLRHHPEVLLIGSEEGLASLPPAVFKTLGTYQVGIEVMNTGAACRTYLQKNDGLLRY
jgi:uncharacterized protein